MLQAKIAIKPEHVYKPKVQKYLHASADLVTEWERIEICKNSFETSYKELLARKFFELDPHLKDVLLKKHEKEVYNEYLYERHKAKYEENIRAKIYGKTVKEVLAQWRKILGDKFEQNRAICEADAKNKANNAVKAEVLALINTSKTTKVDEEDKHQTEAQRMAEAEKRVKNEVISILEKNPSIVSQVQAMITPQEIEKVKNSADARAIPDVNRRQLGFKRLRHNLIEKYNEFREPAASRKWGSHLADNVEQEQYQNYQSLVKNYASVVSKMGGIENVIKSFEDYLRKMIYEAGNKEQISFSKTDYNDQGELSDLGAYKAALRAITSSAGSERGYWENVFHLGSREKNYQIGSQTVPFRDLLAYYWLAASDEGMNNGKEPPENIATSKTNFAHAIAQIRRAYNTGAQTYTSRDMPSCPPGSFSRLVVSSNMFNTLVVGKSVNPYQSEELTKQIGIFIVEKFNQLSRDQRVKIGTYLCESAVALVAPDADEEDPNRDAMQQVLKAFYDENSNIKLEILYELTAFLGKNVNDFKMIINPNMPQELMKYVAEMFKLHLETLHDPRVLAPDQNLLEPLLRVGAKAELESKLENEERLKNLLNPEIDPLRSYKEKTLALAKEIIEIKRKILYEQIENVLNPFYSKSRIADLNETLQKLKKEHDELLSTMIKDLIPEGKAILENMMQRKVLPPPDGFDLEIELGAETTATIASDINIEQFLSDAAKRVLGSSPLNQWVESETAKIDRQILNTRTVRFNAPLPSVQNYTNYVLTLAEGSFKGKCEKKDRELIYKILERINKLPDEQREQFIQCIMSSLENPQIKAKLEHSFAGGVNQFKADLLDHISIDPLAGFVSVKTAMSALELTPNTWQQYQDDLENVEDWNKQAKTFYESDIQKLKAFVFVTLCDKLSIHHTHQMSKEHLDLLCEYYLRPPPDANTKKFNLPISDDILNNSTLEQRIEYLQKHLSTIIETLMPVKYQFMAGNIVLTSAKVAKDEFYEAMINDVTEQIDPWSYETDFVNNGYVSLFWLDVSTPSSIQCYGQDKVILSNAIYDPQNKYGYKQPIFGTLPLQQAVNVQAVEVEESYGSSPIAEIEELIEERPQAPKISLKGTVLARLVQLNKVRTVPETQELMFSSTTRSPEITRLDTVNLLDVIEEASLTEELQTLREITKVKLENNIDQWVVMAKKLVKDHGLNKLKAFVFLTVCDNLQTMNIPLKNKADLDALCDSLISSDPKSTPILAKNLAQELKKLRPLASTTEQELYKEFDKIVPAAQVKPAQ